MGPHCSADRVRLPVITRRIIGRSRIPQALTRPLASSAHTGHSARVPDVIVDDADGWCLVHEERRIDQIQLDFRFGLVLDDGTLIVIECPFVATIDGVATEVAPETLQGVEPALAVLHRQLSEVPLLGRELWRSG